MLCGWTEPGRSSYGSDCRLIRSGRIDDRERRVFVQVVESEGHSIAIVSVGECR